MQSTWDGGRVGAQRLPDWVVSVLKWTLAVVAIVLIANYAAPRAWTELRGAVAFDMGGSDDDLPEADPADTQPREVTEGEILASADVAVSRGAIIGTTAQSVMLGMESTEQMLVGFEPVPADPACITEVILEAFLVESTDHDVYVRPAALADLGTVEDGQGLPADAIIEGTTPSSASATGGTSGWLRWDVSGPYTLAHRTAAEGAPVVLSIAVPGEDPARWSVLGTTESDQDWTPRLRWKAVTGPCEVGQGEGVSDPDPLIEEEAADVTGEATPDAEGDAATSTDAATESDGAVEDPES
jgi:hypothetical protein